MGVRETDVRIGQLANRIRLTFLRDHLAEVLESVPEARVTARDAISYALQKEANQRRSNHFKQALRAALFPWIRTLEAFDFSAQPSINSGVIWDLSNLEWIDAGESVSLFSSSSIGNGSGDCAGLHGGKAQVLRPVLRCQSPVDVSPHRRSTEVHCSRNVTDGFVSVSPTEDFADLIFADHG